MRILVLAALAALACQAAPTVGSAEAQTFVRSAPRPTATVRFLPPNPCRQACAAIRRR